MTKILVVDDEADIVELLRDTLEMSGFTVESTSNGDKALEILETRHSEFDLGLFDIMMPRLSGTGLLKLMRDKGIELPVIFLTAKDLMSSKIEGLQLGADDYITKPFDIRELTERVKTILRRVSSSVNSNSEKAYGAKLTTVENTKLGTFELSPDLPRVLRITDIELDRQNHDVTRAGQFIDLTLSEFQILETLMINQGQVVRKTQLLQTVDSKSHADNFAIIDTHISALRKKLNAQGEDIIETKRGQGYVIR